MRILLDTTVLIKIFKIIKFLTTEHIARFVCHYYCETILKYWILKQN